MWKKAMTLLLTLILILSGLFFWQWKTYSTAKKAETKNEIEQVQQHLTIEAKNDELSISQTVSGLSNQKEYQVTHPETLFRWQSQNEKIDLSNDGNLETYHAAKGELTFRYVIPVQKQHAFLLSEWTASIENVKIMETTIDIVEKESKGGSWVAGIPQKDFEQLDFIDFYSFHGEGGTPALYWQEAPLYMHQENHDLSFYSEQPNRVYETFDNLQMPKKFDFMAVIETDKLQPGKGEGMLIVAPNSQVHTIERLLMYSYYEAKFKPLSPEEQWVFNLLTALSLDIPIVSPRSEAVLQELTKNLTEKQRQAFVLAIQQQDNLLDFNKLDQLIGDQVKLKTVFFSANKNENGMFTHLFFVDTHNLVVNGKIIKNLELTYAADRILFPFADTMKALGYSVDTGLENTFVLTKDHDSYTFTLDHSYFKYNGEDFGLLENPFSLNNGKVYIENKAMQSIFKVIVEENEKEILLYLKNN